MDSCDKSSETKLSKNTLVVVMGDNGVMYQETGTSGYSEWIFRGHKGSSLEGGHRVGAFALGLGDGDRTTGVVDDVNIVAGATGSGDARIFCRRFEAELVEDY